MKHLFRMSKFSTFCFSFKEWVQAKGKKNSHRQNLTAFKYNMEFLCPIFKSKKLFSWCRRVHLLIICSYVINLFNLLISLSTHLLCTWGSHVSLILIFSSHVSLLIFQSMFKTKQNNQTKQNDYATPQPQLVIMIFSVNMLASLSARHFIECKHH